MTESKMLFVFVLFSALTLTAGDLFSSPLLISSPQKESSAGRFRSDADDFLSARGYAGLDFEKWFGVVSFYEKRRQFPSNNDLVLNPAILANDVAQIGFATRFSGVYIGAYYGGNAFRNLGMTGNNDENVNDYDEKTMSFFGSDKTMRVYSQIPLLLAAHRTPIYNEASVLVGFSDMGIRLSYATNYQTFSLNEDFAVDQSGIVNFYKSWYQEFGIHNPEIVWAMAKDLIPGRGIKPEVRLDLTIFRDSYKHERYDALGISNGVETTKSQNRLITGLYLGMGDFIIQQIDNFKWGFDFTYGVNLSFYNNEYSYLDSGNRYQTKSINGILDNSRNISERNASSHLFRPVLFASWSEERIRLSSRFYLDMDVTSEEVSPFKFKTGEEQNGTLVKDGDYRKSDTFRFYPSLELGMQWGIIPGKLFLNVGGLLTLGCINLQTIDQKSFTQGEVRPDAPGSPGSSVAHNNTFNLTAPNPRAKTELLVGFTFNITSNIGLQASCGINTRGNEINTLDTTTDGFFSFANVLATFKF